MPLPTTPLAQDFSPPSRDDWLALVAKTLKGAGLESLEHRTADRGAVRPLYGPEDGRPSLGVPAAHRKADLGWDIRAVVACDSPAEANRVALDALAGGAASLLVRVDSGAGWGVRLSDSDDLTRVLQGVDLDIAPVTLDAGFLGPLTATALAAAAKAAPGAPIGPNLDPLSAFARAGASPGPIDAHVAAAAAVAVDMAEIYPKAGLFLASGVVAHEAGGSPAWELATSASAAVAYAKAMVDAGLSIDRAFDRIALGLAADAEPLAVVAKLRAARILWARIVEACEVAPRPATIEVRSSERMLTRADRWTNLIRLTSAGVGAALGGADAIVLGAFTDAISPPDDFALRMARNTQLILMEEGHLGRVTDPGAGSWAIEALTADLAQAAWAAFTAIEAAGGLGQALASGLVASAVETSRVELRSSLADKTLRIIGVTDFKGVEPEAGAETPPRPPPHTPPPQARLPGPDGDCPALAATRLEEMVS